MYGTTETHGALSPTWHLDADRVDACHGDVPIGRPMWNTRVYVLDERLRPVPVGVAGELYLAGASWRGGIWGGRSDRGAVRGVPVREQCG